MLERELRSLPELSDQEFPQLLNYYGVPIETGAVGDHTPDISRYSKDVITNFDMQMGRDIALAMALNQPVLIEGGSGIGKTRAVYRFCAYTNRDVYRVNCTETDPTTLIGKLTAISESKSGFGWQDGVVLEAIRKGGVLLFDEYNQLDDVSMAALSPYLEALLEGESHVMIADSSMSSSDRKVQIHPDTRIILTQNPPNDRFTNRKELDPSKYTRVVYLAYPDELSPEDQKARLEGIAGLKPTNAFTQRVDDLPEHEILDIKTLAELPSYSGLISKYWEFYGKLTKAVKEGMIGIDNGQPVYFDMNRDTKRLLAFVSKFCGSDIRKTFVQGVEYYFVNRFREKNDREQVRQMARLFDAPSAQNTDRESLSPSVPNSPMGQSAVKDAAELRSKYGKNYIELADTALIGVNAKMPDFDLPEVPDKFSPDKYLIVEIPDFTEGGEVFNLANFSKWVRESKDSHDKNHYFTGRDWYLKDTASIVGSMSLDRVKRVAIPLEYEIYEQFLNKDYDERKKVLDKLQKDNPNLYMPTAFEMAYALTMYDIKNSPVRDEANFPLFKYLYGCSDTWDDRDGACCTFIEVDRDGADIGYDLVGYSGDYGTAAVFENF